MERSKKVVPVEQRAKIIRRHLLDGVPVSDLCEEYGIHPTVYYRWQRMLFENADLALAAKKPGRTRQSQEKRDLERISKLERKLERKNEVLAELMEEHVALKKSLGES